MKYIVGEYCSVNNAHKCKAVDSYHNFFIDLMVNGDFEVADDDHDQFIKDLIGKTVEIEELTYYVAIGHGVKVLK